ncbi:unnamed protein product [Thelazia callipaeda]|uniref:Uncharacterized protein n=1 Tax=Thelazia callipaeda TaxID=103827 RepID=A0A0N5D9E8_THECL|nr:unnamed protein product [Thelazia callipaeda]
MKLTQLVFAGRRGKKIGDDDYDDDDVDFLCSTFDWLTIFPLNQPSIFTVPTLLLGSFSLYSSSQLKLSSTGDHKYKTNYIQNGKVQFKRLNRLNEELEFHRNRSPALLSILTVLKSYKYVLAPPFRFQIILLNVETIGKHSKTFYYQLHKMKMET